MSSSGSESAHPGLSVGPTSEFGLFFHVRTGDGPSLRSALLDLQGTPGYRPGDYGMGRADDPRGALRALRRRHPPRLHHELRRPLGRLHGLGEGQPIEQAIAIMMDAHWRSAVHPDRIEGIGAFNEGREPTFRDADF
jgi:hypothetical protein